MALTQACDFGIYRNCLVPRKLQNDSCISTPKNKDWGATGGLSVDLLARHLEEESYQGRGDCI